jgi:CRP-like cAMP-binding protein
MKMDASAFVAEPALIKALQQHATQVTCEHDMVLFKQGDACTVLYIFHSGDVRLTMDAQDGGLVMDMPAAQNSLLGLPALIGGLAYSLSAIAKAGARISTLSREKLDQLMLGDHSISMMILRVLAAEVRTARMAITSH